MIPLHSLVQLDLTYITRTITRLECELGSRRFTGEIAEEIDGLARRLQRLAAPSPVVAAECPCDAERTVDPQCCAAGMCAREVKDAA